MGQLTTGMRDMNRFEFDIISCNDVEQIYQETLRFLEESGVVFNHKSALSILERNGAEVDFKTEKVRFPSALVKEAVTNIPKKHSLHFRNEKSRILHFGVGNTHFSAGGYGKMVIDLKTGERRLGTSRDIEQILVVDDALDCYDTVGCSLFPTDVPNPLVQIKAAEMLLRYSTKPFTAEAQNLLETTYIVRMAEAVVEDPEILRKKPIIEFYACCTSPLIWHKNFLDVVIYAAERGIPVSVCSAPICGVTSPVTLAGMLVLQYSEILSAATLLHLINRTLPISLAIIPIMLNFKEGNCNVFSPERLLVEAASVQLARLLQMPHHSSVGMTDSKMPTMQAGYEKALGAILLTLAGSESVGPFGNLDDWMTTAPEIHVIDGEIVDSIKRMIKGMSVSSETLATDVIAQVGAGNSYIGLKHTRELFNVEHILPRVGFKGSWEALKREGKNAFMEDSEKQVKRILETHKPKPIGNIGAMELVVKDAEKVLLG